MRMSHNRKNNTPGRGVLHTPSWEPHEKGVCNTPLPGINDFFLIL